jgi:hypothetical protein
MYFLTADAAHLQTRLNHLAQRGLELTDTTGLFTGVFAPTKRSDLTYLVLPYGRARNFQDEEDGARYGWQLVGGFNGMAIWKSLPCAQPDADALRAQVKEQGGLHPDRFTVPILLVALILFTLELWLGADRLGLSSWYLSYQSMGFGVLKWIVLALTAVNLLTLHSYLSAWVRGFSPWCLMGSVLAFLLLTVFDQRGETIFFLLVLLIIALACGLSFWQRNRALALSTSGVCLAVLCLGLLFPNAQQVDTNSRQLHNQMADQPVIQLTDLGEDETLFDTEYSTGGTFLVQRINYYEWGEEHSVSSQVYRCLTESLAQQLQEQLLTQSAWQQTQQGWQTGSGKTVLLRQGKLVAVVTYDQPLEDEQIASIQQTLIQCQ